MNILDLLQASEFGKIVLTFFVSMLPIIELRGALPLGVAMGLTPVMSLIVSVVGNILPVPFIILFVRRVFKWMQSRSQRLARIAQKLESKARWTGALIAAILNIRLKVAFPAVLAGVVAAGLIVFGITYGFTKAIS